MSIPGLTFKTLLFQSTSLAYYIKENPGKETLVLLHPAYADHTVFEPQIAFFEPDFQIICFDLPGHGRYHARNSALTLALVPDMISCILNEHDIKSCHVLGVSLGSLAAQAFAHRFPERAQSVTVVGGYPVYRRSAEIRRAQTTEGIKWALCVLFSMKRFKQYVLVQSCHTEAGRALFSRGIGYFERKSFRSMSGMQSFFALKEPPGCPVLVVTGRHDRPVSVQAAGHFGAAAEVVLLENAGHCANLDNPDAFNAAAAAFFEKIGAFIKKRTKL